MSQLLVAVKVHSRSGSAIRPDRLLALFRRTVVVLSVCVSITTCCLGVAQQCSAPDIIALSKAGYTKQDINALCMVDVALLDESARLDLSVPAMNQFLEAILPLQVSANGAQNGVLQSVKYCKADGDHVATLVAYGSLQGGAGNSGVAANPVSHLKGPLDCSMSADLNRSRQSALGAPLGVQDFFATLTMEWSPWSLHFKISAVDQSHAGLVGESTL